MHTIIRSDTRGLADHGWLKAKHTFSFADYYDPERIRFGPLRVVNEDRIAGGKGFDMHPHRDMEILTYVISGAIEHQDNMGNGSVIRAGAVQRMTAGTGVLHSEYNHSPEDELHLLQIWLFPNEKGLTPGYEQTTFSQQSKLNNLRLIASPDGSDGSITVHQDDYVYASILEANHSVTHKTFESRRLFVQVVSGTLRANETVLTAGDGLQVRNESELHLVADENSEFVLFDMR